MSIFASLYFSSMECLSKAPELLFAEKALPLAFLIALDLPGRVWGCLGQISSSLSLRKDRAQKLKMWFAFLGVCTSFR
jgi:hypothetical protein